MLRNIYGLVKVHFFRLFNTKIIMNETLKIAQKSPL